MKNLRYAVFVKLAFLATVMVVWEMLSSTSYFGKNTELIFPSLETIGEAFVLNFTKGYGGTSIYIYICNSMELLTIGLVLGILIAFLLSGLSMVSKICKHIFELLINIFDLLPGVAILPVVIIMFGIKPMVIVFLIIHSVLWPLARNILDGFMSVPVMYLESGLNMGMSKYRLLTGVYLPAASPYIISGIKVGWARAWRGLISAEMIFGIASCPGIGLYINQMRTNMNNAEMYATLIVIIIIGLLVQYGIFLPIECLTVRRWGVSK